ncbi:uncharacterized protein METZ01_LOCUS250925, partial [marine metagenome]
LSDLIQSKDRIRIILDGLILVSHWAMNY